MHMSVNSFRIAYGFFSNERRKTAAATKILKSKKYNEQTNKQTSERMEKLVVVAVAVSFLICIFILLQFMTILSAVK